jgi:hypothetical protein
MPETPSLVDFANKHVVDIWAVFTEYSEHDEWSWFFRFLKPGFRHVEIWRYFPPGAWIRVNTCIEVAQIEVYADPPWVILASQNPTPVRVRRTVPIGFFRSRFNMGPETCVSQAAGFLGLRLPFWCRTPYGLYKHLRVVNEEAENS